MDLLLESVKNVWLVSLDFMPKILGALLVLVIAIWVGRKLAKILVTLLVKTSLPGIHKGFFRNTITWLFALLGLIIALDILGLEKAAVSLLAGGGITAVVLGFAFREIGENFLAGFFLAFSRPFNIGDTIQSGDFIGSVKSIELRNTHIRTSDGRDIFIPSSQIFNQALINYTKDGLRRPSFVIGIDYGDDAIKAVSLLLDVAKNFEGVLKDPPPGVYISEMTAAYVQLEVFFWLDVFKEGINLLNIKSELMDGCKNALLDNGFTLSSETTTNIAVRGKIPVDTPLQD
jgi:small-conductance mechanosensitive channel